MISFSHPVFRLSTRQTSYVFRITPYGHLEHVYYGPRIPDAGDVDSLAGKRTAIVGSSVNYQEDGADNYCLDTLCLEWSGMGRGDYRETALDARMPDGTFISDFTYVSHAVQQGPVPPEALPGAYGDDADCETLSVTLQDKSNDVFLTLVYTVYMETDVVTRRAVIENRNEAPMELRRVMSMQLDMENRDFSLVTFDGGWISETHRHDRPLQPGTLSVGSVTGASSNRHNAGFLLYERDATEEHGLVYGCNLVYSGNHIGLAELASTGLVRVQTGIHPQGFSYTLSHGERFETPEAVLTCSADGFNGMSAHFHDFINRHIVRGDWKDKERPVLLNDWEACFFRFTGRKLLRLARQAKSLGVELFVLDDGWFSGRNSDRAGLGDYTVDTRKLPGGLARFSRRIHGLGLRFGLWFEPEMVNPDSDLYRVHPDWAVTTPGKTPTFGRNQLVLDLCNASVRDYIVENVGRILDEANVDYVKWDMNRHISDAYSPCIKNQGEFFHRYMLGLYDVLARIFRPRPHILFESCSSGGNRFDLGILCFSQQVWASDDTDPVERLAIQAGLSYLYPLSTMGAHVSAAPHQQTLRDTPLATRFNVSAFGCLGYELNPQYFTPVEKKEVREQIAFYQANRRTLQYGRFTRATAPGRKASVWQCTEPDKRRAVAGFFLHEIHAAEGNDVLPLLRLCPDAVYTVQTKPQRVFIKRFGGLVKHLLPFEPHPDGWLLRTLNKVFALPDCVETYRATGAQLMQGVHLNSPFLGTGYAKDIRMVGDFGSNLYIITQTEDANE